MNWSVGAFHTSKPLIPGSIKSRIIKSGETVRTFFRPSVASFAVYTVKSNSPRNRFSRRLSFSSSSMTRIFQGIGFASFVLVRTKVTLILSRSGFKTPSNTQSRRCGPSRSVSGGPAPDTEYIRPCMLRFFVGPRVALGHDLRF